MAGGIAALRLRPARPLVAGNLARILGALPLLALVPLATWESAAAAALGGAGAAFLNSVWAATMQELIPDRVRSRVDSYDWLVSNVVMPVGFAIGGPAAETAGDAATLAGAALMASVPCLLVVMLPAIRGVRRAAASCG